MSRAVKPSISTTTGVAALTLLLLAGCAWEAPLSPAPGGATAVVRRAEPVTTVAKRESRIQAVVDLALAQLGTPYAYGGANPRGFDCSGLVNYAYGRNGVVLPRTTRQLWNQVPMVSDGAPPRPGDLLFFHFDGKLSHVGLAIDERQFIHAPSSGAYVRIDRIDDPVYRRRLTGIRRPLPATAHSTAAR